jgi:hypothetical protein
MSGPNPLQQVLATIGSGPAAALAFDANHVQVEFTERAGAFPHQTQIVSSPQEYRWPPPEVAEFRVPPLPGIPAPLRTTLA